MMKLTWYIITTIKYFLTLFDKEKLEKYEINKYQIPPVSFVEYDKLKFSNKFLISDFTYLFIVFLNRGLQ